MAFELSYAEVNKKRLATMKLVEAAQKDLETIWMSIPDKTDGAIVKMVLEDALGDIIHIYGQNVAIIASQEFEKLRSANKVAGRFTALTAKLPERKRINDHLGAVLEPIFRGENSRPDLAFKEVQGLVDRMVKEPARRTTDENVARSSSRAIGYARVPGRSDSCDFCIMLASRGPVYGKKSGLYRADGHRYHTLCWCEPVPVFDKDTEIEGYDQDALLTEYKNREAEKAKKAAEKALKAEQAA